MNLYVLCLNHPVGFVDAFGLDGQVCVGISGTAGGAGVWGPFVQGQTTFGATTSGQLFLQFEGSGLIGMGAYAGVGFVGGISRSGSRTPTGISWSDNVHGEANIGVGESGGIALDFCLDNQGMNGPCPGVRGGVGYGGMIAVGCSRIVTIATPPLWPRPHPRPHGRPVIYRNAPPVIVISGQP